MEKSADSLIYDWSTSDAVTGATGGRCELSDESLRDGLQSPSVRQPAIEDRLELLRLMAAVGIEAADIGMPATGEGAYGSTLALAETAAAERLPIQLNCAARTVEGDLRPVVEISQRVGLPIEVMAFIGTSPVRMRAEGWNLGDVLSSVRNSVRFAVENGLSVCLVTEDTTRSRPEILRDVYRAGVEEGAGRLCAADTVGYATPDSTRRLIRWIKTELFGDRPDLRLDWHGHNDRGLALANTLSAIDAGADRVHATALGVGERCGNTAMEQVVTNMHLLGERRSLPALLNYCTHASEIFGRPIREFDPVVGQDAFRTATGVHAAAIAKAHDLEVAELVYSGIRASELGVDQQVMLGPLSGRSNVRHWLRSHGIADQGGLPEKLMELTRRTDKVLSDVEVFALAREHNLV